MTVLASFMLFFYPLYFDHDAFMHHALHVLDAHELESTRHSTTTEGSEADNEAWAYLGGLTGLTPKINELLL